MNYLLLLKTSESPPLTMHPTHSILHCSPTGRGSAFIPNPPGQQLSFLTVFVPHLFLAPSMVDLASQIVYGVPYLCIPGVAVTGQTSWSLAFPWRLAFVPPLSLSLRVSILFSLLSPVDHGSCPGVQGLVFCGSFWVPGYSSLVFSTLLSYPVNSFLAWFKVHPFVRCSCFSVSFSSALFFIIYFLLLSPCFIGFSSFLKYNASLLIGDF